MKIIKCILVLIVIIVFVYCIYRTLRLIQINNKLIKLEKMLDEINLEVQEVLVEEVNINNKIDI